MEQKEKTRIDSYKVSVIVPVYNVELYLEKCLNSILEQKGVCFELILVNDGSQDNSPQICDRYKDKYENVSVIHKKNEGLGYARNSGLEIAQGDYILFVDSDDWIVEDSLSILVKKIENSNAEIVCFDSIRTNDVSYSFNKKDTSEDQIVDNKELMKRYLDDKISSTACAKLFKSDLFEKVRFTDICLHEDAYIMHLIFENVKRAVVSREVFYIQYIRKNSLMQTSFAQKNFICIECGERLIAFARLKYPELEIDAQFNCLNRQLSTISFMMRSNCYKQYKTEYRQIINNIRKEIKILREHKSINSKLYLRAKIISAFPICYVRYSLIKNYLERIVMEDRIERKSSNKE